MSDRHTHINKNQEEPLVPSELDADNSPSDGKVPSKKSGSDQFTWVDKVVLTTDDFTIINNANVIKIADRIELNTYLLAYKLSVANAITKFALVNGMSDEFEDETGVDTGASINQVYEPTDDYYNPLKVAGGWDTYTKLVCHFDVAKATSVLADTGQTLTYISGADCQTTTKKWTGSLLLNGSSDYVTVPASADWNFGTGDFTIDFWVYLTSLASASYLTGQGMITPTGTYYQLNIGTDGEVNLSISPGGNQFGTTGAGITATTWNHIALIRNGATTYIYVNGVPLGSQASINWLNYTLPYYIGAMTANGSTYYTNGYIEEFRISKGIARWTTNFSGSLPSIPYAPNAGITNNMTLKSNVYTAVSAPTKARPVLFEQDVDAITINTDLKIYVSRDNGTTYTQVTLIDEGYYESGKRILSCNPLDISGQPSGTNIKWKVETLNNKDLKLHCVGLAWQ